MGQPVDPASVPECRTPYYVTRPKKKTKKGYVGFETEWIEFHREVPYETPKAP